MSVEDLLKGMFFGETFVDDVEEFSSQVGFDSHINELTDFKDCMLDMNLYIYILYIYMFFCVLFLFFVLFCFVFFLFQFSVIHNYLIDRSPSWDFSESITWRQPPYI